MCGPRAYEFIGKLAIYGPKAYEFVWKLVIYGPTAYEFIGKVAIYGPKAFEFIGKLDIYSPKPKSPRSDFTGAPDGHEADEAACDDDEAAPPIQGVVI